MAFQNTKERYASFGVATTIAPEIIDSFWRIIDQNLKGVFSLDSILIFHLKKNKQRKLVIDFFDKKTGIGLAVDSPYLYDPFLPHTVYVVDNAGIETILLGHEVN
ncbi:DUF960 domain-containing protein [Streptococcus didelphis]|uniref:DUF960 domain-containing protein n=1 Tax=Streptococcus didelphis TaxID=102886 RepID=A0ABY9LGK0_9STRE|nr:DUF960 domain-containing protein [Streptococcus didelphis]WMB28006.1 DUF960 domain-containing protein [Streptococcus didelphis]WMB29526.1 DUF960 domain-containing protein [Streptococcus didelphis]WMB29911.1 DUF960 domain-containing protein [Streptococcus didelphis]